MTGPSAVPPLEQSHTPSRPSRGPLVFAAAVALVWIAMLIGTAWLTSDPVTLNRDQILRADFVITGKVESDPHVGEVSVSREWRTNGPTGTIHVENLEDARANRDTKPQRGATYLMPLSRAATGYRVTEARMEKGAVLIYPASPAAIEQLENILADRPAVK